MWGMGNWAGAMGQAGASTGGGFNWQKAITSQIGGGGDMPKRGMGLTTPGGYQEETLDVAEARRQKMKAYHEKAQGNGLVSGIIQGYLGGGSV